MALSGFIDQMVHESVRARAQSHRHAPICAPIHAHEYVRQSAFVWRMLILPLAAGLAAPLLVVMQGALPRAQIFALALGILPLISVLLMQRGRAPMAHSVLSLTWAALASVFLSALSLPLAGVICLALAVLEAAQNTLYRRPLMALLAGMAVGIWLVVRPFTEFHVVDCVLAGVGLVLVAHVMIQSMGEHARQEAAYLALHDQHRSLENLVADARLHFSRSAAVRFIDGACAARLGLTRRDLSGRGFFERVQMADRPVLIKALGQALDGCDIQTLRLAVHLRDEESPRGRFQTPVFATLELRLKRMGGDEVMALVRDVSALVEAEAIVAAHRIAKVENRDWKDRILAHASHELRTPLNAIIGFSDILGTATAPDDAIRREYASIIHTSGQHLLSIVNSILDMSQMEAGALRLSREEFSFAALVDECCEMMNLQAQEAGVILHRQVQRDVQNIFADQRACRQIVINLLSNAIKFTPHGGHVTVHAQQAGQDVLVAIRDTGCGIAPEHLPHIGNPFFQARGDGPQMFEGTGLGLSVVKGLIALHGGSMTLESIVDQGTCVTFRLPLDCRSAATNPEGLVDKSMPQPVAVPLPDMMMVKKIA